MPGTPPSNPRVDNVPAMSARGNALMVRSGEWIINERQSRINDRFLHAINSGLDLNKILPGFAGGGRVPGGSSSSGGTEFTARLADNRVHVKGGLLELIDDRVLVTVGGMDDHAKQAQARRRG